jgi:putative Mg2+ transporter-C (MgtC) family protein
MIDLLAQAAPVLAQPELARPEFPSQLELALRLVLAGALAGLIGLERELTDHPSGLRTHMAVAIGSCLFCITSGYAFTEFIALQSDNNYSLDPSRIAAQVVSGIGFLGGGAIIKQGNTVRGLTSAAGLWVSAAVGMAVAFGMYLEATVGSIVLVLALTLLRAPRRWIRIRMATGEENVVVKIDIDTDPSPVVALLHHLDGCTVHSVIVRQRPDDGITVIEAQVESKGGMISSKVAHIEERDDVLSVEVS